MSTNSLDLSFLTQEERDILLGVIQRDEDLRIHEENKKKELLVEIIQLKHQSAVKVGQTQKARECVRCHKELGLIRNHGEACPKCHHLICITCHVDLEESKTYKWLCSLCHKQRLLPAITGEWFFNQPLPGTSTDSTPRSSPISRVMTPFHLPPSVLIKTSICQAPISVVISRSLNSNSSLQSASGSSRQLSPQPYNEASHTDENLGIQITEAKPEGSASLPVISIIDDEDRHRVIALEELDNFNDGVCKNSGEERDVFAEDEDIDNLFEEAKRTHIWRPPAKTSTESLTSIYSEAGAIYSHHNISGDIQFSVEFSEASRTISVKVNQCRNLTAINGKKNTSDPYVKIYLLPDRSKSSKRKSRVKKNTINPVYTESFMYALSKDEDLSNRTLQVAVWNFHRLGHSEFLGEVTLPLVEENMKLAQQPQWYNLEERMKMDSMDLQSRGELRLSMRYVLSSSLSGKAKNPGAGEIQLKIIEAKNLIGKKSPTHSDPFVKGMFQPEKLGRPKQKTKIVRKSVNPCWDEVFTFSEVMLDELSECGLEITVWDYDRFSSKDFLGGSRLNAGRGLSYGQAATWTDAEGRELQAWHEMMNNPDKWVECWIPLRASMSH